MLYLAIPTLRARWPSFVGVLVTDRGGGRTDHRHRRTARVRHPRRRPAPAPRRRRPRRHRRPVDQRTTRQRRRRRDRHHGCQRAGPAARRHPVAGRFGARCRVRGRRRLLRRSGAGPRRVSSFRGPPTDPRSDTAGRVPPSRRSPCSRDVDLRTAARSSSTTHWRSELRCTWATTSRCCVAGEQVECPTRRHCPVRRRRPPEAVSGLLRRRDRLGPLRSPRLRRPPRSDGRAGLRHLGRRRRRTAIRSAMTWPSSPATTAAAPSSSTPRTPTSV